MNQRDWQRRRPHCHPFEVLEFRNLLSATPQLLADINLQQSGSPSEMIEFQGRLYFVATDASVGREIWSTDGTTAGTQLLADLNPGPGSSSSLGDFVVSGDYLFFSLYSSTTGTELWRTDGTAAGTQLVRDIAPGTASGLWSFEDMVDVAGTLYFIAADAADRGLWKSDGTEAGTTLVKVIGTSSFSIQDLTAVGDKLFFIGNDGVHGDELWKSDGTPGGTVMLKDIEPGSWGSRVSDLVAYGGELYFEATENSFNTFLWKSNGTAAGTKKVQLPSGLDARYMSDYVVSGGWLYFRASVSTYGWELWRTDGTLAGTSLVVDLVPGTLGSSIQDLFDVDGTLYFSASVNGESQLFKTDGTSAGTTWLASLAKNGQSPSLWGVVAYEGNLYFTTYGTVFGTDLWRSDGTPLGTYPLHAGIAPALSTIELVVAAGQLFFTGNMAGTGHELWRTTGDYSNTRIVKDFVPEGTDYSSPRNFVTAGEFVYFTADDGYGEQLWVSNGSAGNAVRLTHSAYGVQRSQVEQLTPAGDLLYFVAKDIQGRRYLGVSNGTRQGTRALAWPAGISDPQIQGLRAYGDGILFIASDATQGFVVLRADEQQIEVMQTLGTAWSLPPTYSLNDRTYDPVVWQGNYYFLSYSATELEIWRTDGTAGGTVALRSIAPEVGRNASTLTVTDSALYFIARQPNGALPMRIWRTDGTAEGTWHVPGVNALKMIGAGDKLFYTTPNNAWPSTNSLLLGVTDGTPEGTLTLGTIFDEHTGGGSPHLKAAAFDGELYFFGTAYDPPPTYSNTAALWKSDGTLAGTSRVAQIGSGYPSRLDIAVIGGKLLISDFSRVYMSDGTAEGTALLSDAISAPYLLKDSIAALNNHYYFSGHDATTSSEPFYLQYQTTSPSAVIGRHLFYNQSKFDGNTAGLSISDDNAIAPDKTAYLAGSGVATINSFSSYWRGINGVMIDFENLPSGSEALTLADFEFRVGASNNLATWTTAPAPSVLSIRSVPAGDGARVSIAWASGAIKNTWLEVTVLANERTGLQSSDVFYFGNRIGDTQIASPPTIVSTSAADELATRFSPGINQPITSPYDFDRNGVVNAGDALIARNNVGVLLKLNLPGPAAAAPLAVLDDDDDRLTSLAEPLAAWTANSQTAAPLAAQPANVPSRGELLAYALQSWTDLLDADEDEELIGGLFAAPWARR